MGLSASGGGGGAGRNAKNASLADIRHMVETTLPESSEFYNIPARVAIVQTSKQGQRQPLSYKACSAPREGTQLLCNKRVDEMGRCPVCGSVGKGVARQMKALRLTIDSNHVTILELLFN